MGYFNVTELGLPENSWKPFEQFNPPVVFPPGHLVYLQGTAPTRFYYLKSGRVKIFLNSEDGSEKILTVYDAGNLFGEASFFDGRPRMSSAVTVTRCEVVVIDRQVLATEMARDPEIVMTLLKGLSRTVRMLSGHVDTMAFLRADQRIARYLLSIPVEEGNRVRCTQEELAAAVSVSRVTASRVLSRFVQAGILRTGYGVIYLLKPDLLRQYANQDAR